MSRLHVLTHPHEWDHCFHDPTLVRNKMRPSLRLSAVATTILTLAPLLGCSSPAAVVGPATGGGQTGTGGATGGGTGGMVVPISMGTGGSGSTGGIGSGGAGGNTLATGRGGATGMGGAGGNVSAGGGAGTAQGGQAAGGTATGGRATGGTTSPAGGQGGGTAGAGGVATGGAGATGGQGGGNPTSSGGSGAVVGTGGLATGGAGGSGGRATGGTTSSTGGGGGATGGTSGSGGATAAYHPCPTDGTACKIMPFGDSITDGYNADTPGGYRVELFRLAHSAGKNITFVGSGWNGPDTVDGAPFPHNHEGHSGWTIAPAGGRSGISTLLKNDSTTQSVMLKYTPHIVLLMIGTNDAIDNYDMANAPTRLGALIDTIFSQLPEVLLVVAQPIPARGDASKGDDTGLSARIKTFDDAIPGVVKARADQGKHILVVDMFTPFNPNKASLLEDQWHPNLQGYVLLGTQWYQVLQSLL
jgi:lysophospholipase L1-like esterase